MTRAGHNPLAAGPRRFYDRFMPKRIEILKQFSIAVGTAAALLLLGGCVSSKAPAGDRHLTLHGKPFHAPSLLKHVVRKRHDPIVVVYKLTLPVGTFSANRKVWRQLNENVVGARTTVLLAENGLRAGEAPRVRWPAIARLINVQGSLNQPIICKSNGRSALTLLTRKNVQSEIVAYIDHTQHQVCRTYVDCDDGLMMAMRLVDGGRATQVALEPVVHLGTVSFKRNGMHLGIAGGVRPLIKPFAGLQLAVVVRRKHFLVVCPAAPKKDKFSIGSQFLSHTQTLPTTETVLVFVPVRKK